MVQCNKLFFYRSRTKLHIKMPDFNPVLICPQTDANLLDEIRLEDEVRYVQVTMRY
jgi:hypothetical protein